jgi:F0F1-type ATP synthase assembly protein I
MEVPKMENQKMENQEELSRPVPPEVEERNSEYITEEATHQIDQLKKTKEAEEYQEAMKESGPYLTLGIQLAVSIAAFAGIGYWIDSANGTSPKWLGIFSGAGAVVSLFYFIFTVLRLSKIEETKRHKN